MAGTGEASSVHLSDWPSVKEPDSASQKVLDEMQKARQYIAEGLAQRAQAKIKVRQPLASITIPDISDDYRELVQEEVNVKEVKIGNKLSLDIDLTKELKAEGLARELIRNIQSGRKKAGFNVEDRIRLKIESDSVDITRAVDKFQKMIFSETLAEGELENEPEHKEQVKVEGHKVVIKLRRI
jgi:isoleucyl-tRNA synthetase